MSALRIGTAPAAPLSAADIRAQSRIDHTDEDGLLDAFIASAAEHVSHYIGRPVGATVYRLTLDGFPDGEILLPRPPVVSVDSITYTDANGGSQSLDVGTLQVDTESEPARIRPAVNGNWPDTQAGAINAVQVTYTAGVDADIPRVVLQAIRMTVADWYEHREGIHQGAKRDIPDGVQRLLSGTRFRCRSLALFLAGH